MIKKKETKDKFDNLSALINNTPLFEISIKYKGEDRKVYAKAEYYNFSGSIKDRIAYHILKYSYENVIIKEGDIIAEASSGNTGISFAAIGAYLGNPVSIFMPDWMCTERIQLIESFGAKINLVSKEKGGFIGSIKLAEKMKADKNAFLPCQFSNPLNIDAHYKTTGQEILMQLNKFDKKPEGIVAGVGTGGTIMGLKKALKKKYPTCRAFPLDPSNSPTLISGGKITGPHRIAGIGDEFIPKIINLSELDDIIMVEDGDAINMAKKLASDLGIGVGISSGANFLGVLKAHDIIKNKDAVVVTVFADDNKKYLSTDYTKEIEIKGDYLSKDVELVDFKAVK